MAGLQSLDRVPVSLQGPVRLPGHDVHRQVEGPGAPESQEHRRAARTVAQGPMVSEPRSWFSVLLWPS